MKGRTNCTFVIVSFMLFFALSFISIPVYAAPTTITYLTPWPSNAYDSANFIKYVEEIQKEADQKFPGELNLVYKGGPEVINTFEQVEALRKGAISMLLSAPSYYASAMPELDLLGLTSMKPWEQRATGLFEYIDKLHNEKTNSHYLAQSGIGVPFQFHLSKPIKSVEDLKGMKLRVSPTIIPFIKAVGAIPVGMPPSDIYTAMERGVVQGFVLPAYTARDFGLVKVTKYLVFPGPYFPTNSWLVNLDVWKKLPKHLQDFLDQKAQEYEHLNFARIAERHEKEMEYFKAQGITIITLAPAEAQKFMKIAREALIDAVRKKAPAETEKILSFIEK
jgi:TRAP-type transport system periplasmic protein